MRRSFLWSIGLILALAASSAAQPAARRVLILNSLDIGFAIETAFIRDFRAELSRQFQEPITFFQVSMQPTPSTEAIQEDAVADYLRASLAGQRLDLVITIGAPAALFARRHRAQVFPDTPVVLAADRRWLRREVLTPLEVVAPFGVNPISVVDAMLRTTPQVTNLLVVVGSSRFERAWADEMRRDFQRLADRLNITWSDDLSFADTLQRAAAMPANSAILFALLSVDAKGLSHSEVRVLQELHRVATAPLYGIFTSQLGQGIVGGPLMSIEGAAERTAGVGVRLLRGVAPASIDTTSQPSEPAVYDARELRRWGISEARLPAGSSVLFREPTLWDQYRSYIVGAVVVLGLQSALIAGLVVQRTRRRRMELALRESEERFRRMANGAPVMVWTATPDMATDFFNTTVLEFTGLPIEQLLGDGWLERIHPDDLDQCQRTYVPSFEARQPFHMEYRFRRADGHYRWVLDSGVPRYDETGAFVGYIGSALDITERRQIEQSFRDSEAALRRSYEQNQDLAGRLINAQEAERTRIARDLHDDVSQQLAGFGIMLSTLRRRVGQPGSDAGVAESFATLQARTASLAQSIRNLSHQLHPSVLEHAGLVATLQRHCAEVEEHHHITVVFIAADELDSLGRDAALCLFRVAQEALANSVRHARAQTIRVQLAATDHGVEMQIVDDGVGFVASEQAAIGLGLRSIDERVRLTGGSVDVTSQPGHGTSLLVRVPLAATQKVGG